jgi:uncharacterized repeat protein (TIGR01451 family)
VARRGSCREGSRRERVDTPVEDRASTSSVGAYQTTPPLHRPPNYGITPSELWVLSPVGSGSPPEGGVMRRSSTVTRTVLPRKAVAVLVATIASVALLPCGVAAAHATVTSEFDTFALGTINGQHGWTSHNVGGQFGAVPFDQEIVPVHLFYPGGVTGFGTQAWRFSNLRWSTTFEQTFSPLLNEPVTEDGPITEFIDQFSFITTTSDPQPGLSVGISPDHGAGGRMSLLQLIDTGTPGPAGRTAVFVWDTTPDGSFERHAVAVLPRGVPHTIKFWIKLEPGPHNDVMAIFIDGMDVGQRFTTWENYYREAEHMEPPEINTLLFRASEPGFSGQDAGYLFSGETTTSEPGPGPPEPDVGAEKTASTTTVHPGGLVRYTITARNRGGADARNLLVCDRIPSEETFVSADHSLLRLGPRRCVVINNLARGQHMSFHLMLRVNRNAPAGRIDNTSDETEGIEPPGPPLGPPAPPAPPGPTPAPTPEIPGHITDPKPAEEGGASVDVVHAAQRPPAAPRPPAVTG